MDLLLVIEYDAHYKQKGDTNQNNFCSKELVNPSQENTRKTAKGSKGITAPIVKRIWRPQIIYTSSCPEKCSGKQRCKNLIYVIWKKIILSSFTSIPVTAPKDGFLVKAQLLK